MQLVGVCFHTLHQQLAFIDIHGGDVVERVQLNIQRIFPAVVIVHCTLSKAQNLCFISARSLFTWTPDISCTCCIHALR